MATPPFDIEEAKPANGDIVSQFPTNERTNRDVIESAIGIEHGIGAYGSEKGGRHRFGVGNDAARNAITTWEVGSLWLNTATTPVSLQRVVSINPDVWETVSDGALKGANNTWTGTQTITTTGTGDILTLISTDAGASAGPGIMTDRQSASPAANDVLAIWRIQGKDSGGNAQQYASMFGKITDPTNGSEDGEFGWNTVVAGTQADRMRLGAGLYSANASGGDKGADTLNFNETYRRGVLTFPIVSQSFANFSAVATGTTVLPQDDTIPQITEGDEYMTAAITPKSASNLILIEVQAMLSHSVNSRNIGALFNSDTGPATDAICVGVVQQAAAGQPATLRLFYEETAGSTTPRTYRFRAGAPSAGTTTFNGAAGARLFGSVVKSIMTITEIAT